MNNGKDKAEILASIRKHKAVPATARREEVSEPTSTHLSVPELRKHFIDSLQEAGAKVVSLEKSEVDKFIASTWENVLDFSRPEVRIAYPPSCPLEKLNQIEHALFRGNFGVAENGAIWLEDKDLPHRLIPFITQHLILVVDTATIVAHMQDAYQQMNRKNTGYGVFISGPSKTADIEQSLVYGAHGAKELTVLLT